MKDNIVVIIGNLNIGGAERLVVDDVNEMHRRGIPVTLVTLLPEGPHSYMRDCVIPDVQKQCIPFNSMFDLRAWRKLVHLLRNQKTDTVITHLWFANTIGRIAALLARVPVIISFEHNVYDRVKTHKQFFTDWMLQRVSTRIVAVSDAVRESLIAHGIAVSCISVIENGINLSRYQEAKSIDIRVPEHIPAGTVFLFVGRLIEQKGVDVLLEALAHVPDTILLIAGDGPDREKLKQQSIELGINSRVRFLGIRDDIPVLMKSVDCLVLPSRWEGLPMVVPEAFAAGLPVIVTDFSTAPSIIHNEINGLMVARESVQNLAEALTRVCDVHFRQQLTTGAVQSADRFSIIRHVDELLALA